MNTTETVGAPRVIDYLAAAEALVNAARRVVALAAERATTVDGQNGNGDGAAALDRVAADLALTEARLHRVLNGR